MIVTDAPLGNVCVNVVVPLSRTTVFVSTGSASVSLASTPGAATFSVVSSSVVPLSSTAVGGSLTHVTLTDTVAVEPPGVSVYVNVSGEVPGGALQ